MSTIALGNVFAQTPPGPIRTKAHNILRYRAKGYQFTPQYKAGGWDGYVRLQSSTGHYPAGLTQDLVEQLAAEGYPDVGVRDDRLKPSPHPHISASTLLVPLDTYQQRAVEQAERATRGVVEHPTGTGKGRLLAAITQRLGVCTLVLVHRKELLRQVVEEMRESLDIPALVGAIGAGDDDPRPITCATFQSLHHRLKQYPQPVREMLGKFQAVLVDEAHHVGGAKTYEEIMKALTNCYYRVGLSATAHRSDDQTKLRVTGWLGPIISEMSVTQGVEAGRIVPADVYMVNTPPPHPDGLVWSEAYERGVVNHDERNRIAVELACRLPGLSMVLVERIEHGKALMKLIGEEYPGVGHDFLHGSLQNKRRSDALDLARNERLDVLIGTEILGEGVNVPAVRNLIVARAGRAPHRTIQAVGRGVRAHGNKDRVIVIDFNDTDTTYTREGDAKAGPLTTQARTRRRTYESEEAYSVTDIDYEELTSWL